MNTGKYRKEDDTNQKHISYSEREPVTEVTKEQHGQVGQYEFGDKICSIRIEIHISKGKIKDIDYHNKSKHLQKVLIIYCGVAL